MREASITRTTKETDVSVTWNLDGTGKASIDTGIGFFNHMLELLAFHSDTDLTVTAEGDLDYDRAVLIRFSHITPLKISVLYLERYSDRL